MELKVREGPWRIFFSGEIEGHEVEVYTNPESLILSLVFEKEGAVRVGVLIEMFRVFYAHGGLESFIETLPRNAFLMERHTKEETFKFFLIDSGISYSKYGEEEFAKETDAMLEKIKSFSQMVKQVSRAYDVELIELEESSSKEIEAFFSMPLVGLLVAPKSREVKKETEAPASVEGVKYGEIIFGLTKKGLLSREPLILFDRTIVYGGEERDRTHVMHVLVESALLSNIPSVVVDWDNSFKGLNYPNEERAKLTEYKVRIEPVGFPTESFSPGESVKADLNLVDGKSLAEMFGFSLGEEAKIIETALRTQKHSSLADVIRAVEGIPLADEVTNFKKSRVVRFLKLLDVIYPDFFGGENPLGEMVRGWTKALGKTSIIDCAGRDERQSLLALQCLFRGLKEHFRRQGISEQLKLFIFVPDAERIIPRVRGNRINQLLTDDLLEIRKYGVGLALSAPESVDIAKEVKENTKAMLSIIMKNDVGIQVRDRKYYRVLIRPSLSRSVLK